MDIINVMYRIVASSSTRIRPNQPLTRMVYTIATHGQRTTDRPTHHPIANGLLVVIPIVILLAGVVVGLNRIWHKYVRNFRCTICRLS